MVGVLGVTTAFAGLFASAALAGPPERADNPFVCPVIPVSEQAVAATGGAGVKFNFIGDGYTFGPGNAGSAETFNGNVPNMATNDNGAGSPGGAHAAPGDSTYTAIWSGNS
jgi:hypothetical protein